MTDDQQIIQRMATKALIVNDEGQMLILREASTYEEGTNVGLYHLPGGRLNPGEAFSDGLKREVDEETGLQVEMVNLFTLGNSDQLLKACKTK